jgi:ubiquitin carboxyl-terminal hydrolase 4/11/15
VHTHTTGPYTKQQQTVSHESSSMSSYGGFRSGWSYSSNEEGIPLQRGITGLRNLGNTCFMNSTLQCLSATECMLEYWTKEKFKGELNRDNALGWKGKIAEEYGQLVNDLWSGKYKVVAPRGFKDAIGEFAPRFSGYNQQDSSELLSFLLDGIHEDLNRILKKPYTDAVESKGRGDAVVAAEAWETHKKRHDSVIVDNFQGLLKSRVICPTCKNVSVTFDPYMFLSVPLPTAQQEKVVEVRVLPVDPNKPITAYGVKVSQTGSVFDLKAAISAQTGIKLQRLVVGEIWKGKIYKFFPNNHLIGDIRSGDEVWAWEVICMDEQKEQKENDRNLDYHFVQAQTGFAKEETSSWSLSKKIVYEHYPLILPLVIPSSNKISGNALYKQVSDLIEPFLIRNNDSDKAFELHFSEYSTVSTDVLPDDNTVIDFEKATIMVSIPDQIKFSEERMKIENHESLPSSKYSSFSRVREKESVELSACINAYTKEETLTQDNAWYCPSCKDFKCAQKKFDIWSVPKVMIVHLKRFIYSNMYRDKNDAFVDFPVESLDMSNWIVGPQKTENRSLMYDLYAISNHMGGLGGGHYTAYIKNLVDNQWYEMDDSSTSKVNPDSIKSSSAYVLFYRLRE